MSEYIAVVVSLRAPDRPNPDSHVVLGGMRMDVQVDISGWHKVRWELFNVSRQGELIETDTVVLFARPSKQDAP